MKNGKRYASSTDVARLAGVSQSAVSRAYKKGGYVSPEMRSRIMAAAAELEYRPSLIPRIMLTERSNLIAVVVGGLYNPLYAGIIDTLSVRLEDAGLQTLLVHAESGHMLDIALPRLASYRVDAIVSPLAVMSAATAEALDRLGLPVVSFNTPVRGGLISTISTDGLAAGRDIAALFARRGARRPGFVQGPKGSPASDDRERGYRRALRGLGLGAPRTAPGDFRYEGGVAAAHALLGGRDACDAIFCANDLLALGVMDTARRQFGLRVPEDLMVAGFDDIDMASWSSYGLTSFVQDVDLMARHAVHLLTQALETPGRTGEHVVIPATLVERASTGGGDAGGNGGRDRGVRCDD
ncbi:LacI family DNA-binding transcriptional regulator [Gluconacetobacter diazotrophicus]|uniref:LacI family DNA-binding transcriptional regulator n=1 Tax=Gluconacetobacter diazotrophicus TaxID=33996 RepID=A0A7W4I6A4_GLUDI|nr:LacI family DNA-binding transcriptional regulator [Gluconacetobacter diazotrophicus]